MKYKILEYGEVTSSNDIATYLAKAGEPHGTVVVATSQTKGRGRTGRSFISSSENGLYMSIILRPELPCEKYNTLTPLIAVSVVNALEKTTSLRPQIKWVNDIYINERKTCGILTESKLSGNTLEYIICGIGINLAPPENGFPPEISKIAGAVFEKTAPNGYKMELCNAILDELFAYYNNIEDKSYMQKYRSYSMLIGQEVDIYVGNDIVNGMVTDIDDNGALVVKCKDGTTRAFNSGEARVRRAGASL